MERSPSVWIACEECADTAFDGTVTIFYDHASDSYEITDKDTPKGIDWHFVGASTFRCDHLAPDRGRQGAGVFKGKFTRKTIGYRSLDDQAHGKGSPASKMQPRYRP